MASSTWARLGGRPRYPRQIVVMTTERQDEQLREFAEQVNTSISDVVREAIDAGMPVLRKRALRDGVLPAEAAA
jgi:hypothetical protein